MERSTLHDFRAFWKRFKFWLKKAYIATEQYASNKKGSLIYLSMMSICVSYCHLKDKFDPKAYTKKPNKLAQH